MKKKIYLVILVIFLFPYVVSASTNTYERDENNLQISDDIEVTDNNIYDILNTPKVNEEEKIYDFADLFTDEEELRLYNRAMSFIDKYDMDIVIVTIDDNNKSSAKAYADDFYDYNYFGKNKLHDGIIYLIDMDTREMAISTSGEAIIIYDDERIENILDGTYYEIQYQRYYKSALSFIEDAGDYAEKGVPSSNEDYEFDEFGNLVKKKTVNWTLTIIGALIIPSIILCILISRHKGIKLATRADNYIDSSKIVRGANVDMFVTTHTSRIPIPKSSSSSGGGRSGGSSISRGSSGRSHGGGSRRF